MKILCPSCGATHSADGILSDAEARTALLIAAELPADLGPLCIRYLGLFRPGKRALSWDRARKLLDELAEQIRAGTIRRRGRDWPVPAGAWRTALQTMLDKRDSLDLPLKSHGYLLEIVAGIADKAEGAAERAIETARQASRPASKPDDAIESARTQQQNVRTAIALLTTEQTIARTRFRQAYTREQGIELLRGRGYPQSVIALALDTCKLPEHQA